MKYDFHLNLKHFQTFHHIPQHTAIQLFINESVVQVFIYSLKKQCIQTKHINWTTKLRKICIRQKMWDVLASRTKRK